MQAIGIDLGSTSICGVAMDAETGEVLRSHAAESRAFLEGSAPWERIQSVEKIVGLAFEILEALICEETAVIGVTGQMHGIVYYDASGRAVSPLYTWQDGRGDQPYRETTYAQYLHSHTGYGHVTDFYNRVNQLVPSQAIGYCTVHDYLVMRLCGLSRAAVHITDAASFGCFDLKTQTVTYDCDMEAVSGYRIAGTYHDIPVGVAIGDNQASVFSCLPDRDGVLLNVGTGSQVSVISERPVERDGIETRPYFEDAYLVVGAALCGGRAYAALKDFYACVLRYATDVTDGEVYAVMERMLDGMDGTSLRVDTRFSGSRADQSLRGSVSGISTHNFTPEELTYGVLEGMVRELHAMYLDMGAVRRGLVGSGNGIRKNRALQRVAEKTFQTSMRIPRHTEEAACGAALFALVAEGRYRDACEVQRLICFETGREKG